MTHPVDTYFTDEKISDLIANHNWEMVRAPSGLYQLRQKTKRYMNTVEFYANPETVRKYLTE